jgi:hypothetical protein
MRSLLFQPASADQYSTIAIEQETILAFRAIIFLQLPTFLSSNWDDLILGAIVAVLNPKLAVLKAIAAVSNRKYRG